MPLVIVAREQTSDTADFDARFCQAPRLLRPPSLRDVAPPDGSWRGFLAPSSLARSFVAVDGDRTAGRVSAFVSPTRAGVGYVGTFEVAVEDRETAQALLTAATDALRAQGVTTAYGPIDKSTWSSYRYLDARTPGPDGHDEPPFAWEPLLAPHYLEAFRTAGFTDAERYVTLAARSSGPVSAVESALDLIRPVHDAAVAEGFVFRPFVPPARFADDLRPLYDLSTAVFASAFLFEPISFEDFAELYIPLGSKVDYEGLSYFAIDPSGHPCGFLLAFRDRDYVVMKTLAVLPEHRKRGLAYGLHYRVLANAATRRIPHHLEALMRSGTVGPAKSLTSGAPRGGDRIAREAQAVGSWKHEYVLLQTSL